LKLAHKIEEENEYEKSKTASEEGQKVGTRQVIDQTSPADDLY
jgi:hypothetical protein